MRRPAIGGLDHVRLKPACSATEASKSLVVVLVFYGPSTHFRSFRARSVNLATLFLGKQPRQ